MSAAQDSVTRLTRGADLDERRTILHLRPLSTNNIDNPRFDRATIVNDSKETRIVVHERFPQLVADFLKHKRRHGSQVERDLYSDPDWTWQMQVARLVAKRPLVFMTGSDFTVLRNGENIGGAAKEWDRVGTDQEGKRLKLADYLSYDEIMLSSLLGVSGPSYFINDGDRFNRGVVGTQGTYEPRGIIIGLVGARFERPDRMDSAYIQQHAGKSSQHVELDRIFRAFLAPGLPPSRSAQQGSAAEIIGIPDYFDVDMYKGRMRVTVELLLREANARARDTLQTAYVFIVGLGLGVWKVNDEQDRYYVECFTEVMEELSDRVLDSIGTLDFSWINVSEATQRQVQAAAAKINANAIFTKRNPAAKLKDAAARQVLIISYAWDANSFPGNEYWARCLSASGDPAAACMSTISELHNPVLNPDFLEKIYVNGKSAMDYAVA